MIFNFLQLRTIYHVKQVHKLGHLGTNTPI